MTHWTSTAQSRRRRLCAVGMTAAALVGTSTGAGAAHAEAQRQASCPAAESLVPHTTWHRHALASGVVMTSGQTTDSRGVVNLHALRVALTKPRVSLHPLMTSLASRAPLSQLAQGHSKLVAVTNTGYFDFQSGAPTLPLIAHSSAFVLSDVHEPVVGIDAAGLVEAGDVWLSSRLTAGSRTDTIVALNQVSPPQGITEYSSAWGSAGVRTHRGLVRPVVNGVIGAAQSSGWGGATVPTGGILLVANGSKATSELRAIPTHTSVSVSRTIKTTAPAAFVQAYGVGDRLVASGKALTGFTCDSSRTTQPARTAIGFADGGRTLVIGVVAEHPYTSEHGLDNDQMAAYMSQLGVTSAYDFDGSGSTELLAKLRRSSGLTLQTYPADGAERPMPLGLGVAVSPARAPAVKRRHHKK